MLFCVSCITQEEEMNCWTKSFFCCYVSGPWSDTRFLWEGQRAHGMHQKYLNLCSEDERRSYGFGMTRGWVINDRISIFGWTIPLMSESLNHLFKWFVQKLIRSLSKQSIAQRSKTVLGSLFGTVCDLVIYSIMSDRTSLQQHLPYYCRQYTLYHTTHPSLDLSGK